MRARSQPPARRTSLYDSPAPETWDAAGSASPVSARSSSTRLEYAHQQMIDKFRKHEKEYERAVRVKQQEMLRRQQQEERLRQKLSQEEAAYQRAQLRKQAVTAIQRRKNDEKMTVFIRNEQLQAHHLESLVNKEVAIEHRFNQWEEQQEQELQERLNRAQQRDEHRGQVYLRNAFQEQKRKEHIISEIEQQNHSEKKHVLLGDKKQRLAESNLRKQQRAEQAKLHQQLLQEQKRMEQEAKEARRRQIEGEISMLAQSVQHDRYELDLALQRLRHGL